VKLLIATHNTGKLHEYEALLSGLGLRLVSLADAGITWKVQETGTTFAENAQLKAQAYAQASSLLTLADDSGLQVDALGGGPGIHSARHGGTGSDEDRCLLLLRRLEGVPEAERSARFRCVIVIATPMGELHSAEGTCEGRIACRLRGTHGFGYDPVFYLPQYSRTMAELPPEVKNTISHRARAARGAREILRRMLLEGPATHERPARAAEPSGVDGP
jgi:XTP/dITP diphosphohydrolase